MVDGFFREIALVLKYENARQINLSAVFMLKRDHLKKREVREGPVEE